MPIGAATAGAYPLTKLGRSALTVTALNVFSVGLSLLIYPVIARRYTPQETDAFFLALTIPMLFIVPATNAIASVLVPIIVQTQHRRPQAVGEVVGSALAHCTIWATLAALLVTFGVPWIVRLGVDLLPSVSIEHVGADLLWLSPLIVLQTSASVLDAALNAMGFFAVPAVAMFVRQAATLATLLAASTAIRSHSLALAFTIGALAHLMVIAAGWRSSSTPFRVTLRLEADVILALRLAVPVLVSTFVLQGGVVASRSLAAGLPAGSITALDFASRISSGLLELMTSGVLIVILGNWSLYAARGELSELRSRLQYTIRVVLFVVLPIATVLYVLRRPAIDLWLSTKGTPGLTPLTSACLGLLLLGLPADVVSRIYVRMFLVYQKTGVLAKLALARTLTMLVVAVALVDRLGVPAIALGDSLGVALTLMGLALAAGPFLGNTLAGMGGLYRPSLSGRRGNLGCRNVTLAIAVVVAACHSRPIGWRRSNYCVLGAGLANEVGRAADHRRGSV